MEDNKYRDRTKSRGFRRERREGDNDESKEEEMIEDRERRSKEKKRTCEGKEERREWRGTKIKRGKGKVGDQTNERTNKQTNPPRFSNCFETFIVTTLTRTAST